MIAFFCLGLRRANRVTCGGGAHQACGGIGKAGFKTWRRDHLQSAEQEYLAVYTGVRSTANFQRPWLMNAQGMSEAEADAYVAAALDKVVQQLRSGSRDAS